jgi:CRISPR-associated protein Cmr6
MDLKHDENNQGRDTLANRNETILKRRYIPCNNFFSLNTKFGFSLKNNYPGLLIGSGYTHEAIFENKDNKNEAFKIGFFFDHVTGMPCLPGHSIKGALRSVFPNHKNEKYKKEKSLMIVDLLKKSDAEPEICFNAYLEQRKIYGVTYSDLCFTELLGEIIFEGNEPYKFEKNSFLYQQIPLYRKDIFHDAFIIKGGKDDFFLANDYITPHNDPLKDPNPVKFLKILPDTNIQFQFDLKDGLITKEAKERLFKKILLDFGIGAKTNVGYGQFNKSFQKNESSEPSSDGANNSSEPLNYNGRIKVGEKLEAKIIDKVSKKVKITVKSTDMIVPMSGVCPDKDCLVNVKINVIDKNGTIKEVGFMGEKRI